MRTANLDASRLTISTGNTGRPEPRSSCPVSSVPSVANDSQGANRSSVNGSRRKFLKTGAAGGAALVLGFYLPPRSSRARAAQADASTVYKPNAWIRITPDGQITLLVEKPEMGQGPRTAIPMMIAEELEADWSNIRVEQAPTIPSIYKGLSTGGSGAVEDTWPTMRTVGAQAREMLIAAAVQQWSVEKPVDRKDCIAEKSAVVHVPSGRRLRYGELVETAAKLPEIKPDSVRLKDAKDFRYIGKPIERTDVPAKVDGSAGFGIDVRVPGMLYAVIARCPHFGGKLASFDAGATKSMPGVRAVFTVEPLPRPLNAAGGVAVVADSTWAAIQARKALKIDWDKGPDGNESTASLREQIPALLAAPPTFVCVNQGDAAKGIDAAARKVEGSYELAFQAHATMEPMNTTMHVREDGIEVWTPTQWADRIQGTVAQLSKLPPDKITVHMTLSGGSFGRRAQWDYAAEAWQVAKEVKAPVQLVWTREDDLQHDFYRPYSHHRLAGGLDANGKVTAWSHRIISTPIRAVFDPPESLKSPRHVAQQELGGADVVPYGVANFRLDFAPLHSAVGRAWWRSVESGSNAFASESFVDELAHAAGRDPLQFRLDQLAEQRRLGNLNLKAVMWSDDKPLDVAKLEGVLKLAAEKSGWGSPLPAGRGRGIAAYYSFSSYLAHVAEVSVGKDGAVRVHRVVSAVNCGTAVHPDGVRSQAEGAINYALTTVLCGEITVKDAAVEQSNFNDYPVLRIGQAPEIEVHIVPSNDDPTGMGEPGVPPLAPAVANAIFAATGVRVRRLPIDPAIFKGSRAGTA
jgi:isoquinoline 1-oxidoreductase subunit beta